MLYTNTKNPPDDPEGGKKTREEKGDRWLKIVKISNPVKRPVARIRMIGEAEPAENKVPWS